MCNKSKFSFSIFLFTLLSLALLPESAFAGLTGCSRTPQPGDYLSCGLNGPFGPSGPNYIECRSQCTALKNCLNNPPAGGCGTQASNLEACAPGIHDTTYPGHAPLIPPPPAPGGAPITAPGGSTIGFSPTAGCYVVAAAKSTSFVGFKTSSLNRGQTLTADDRATCPNDLVVAYEVAAFSDAGPAIIEASAHRFALGASQLSLNNDFYTDLGGSYEDVQAIAHTVGSAYGVTVRSDVVDNMNTLQDMVDCVKSAMQNN
ncbi:MAG: hypothetical protein KDD64_09970 [Bdellovibrionales bacterium]|nr:hypothetical protein [Bdellovibrionales bacterium]